MYGFHRNEMLRVFNVNCLGATRVTNALIRLIMNSEKKLIMNISSEAGSISTCYRKGWFAYCGSKAALNMHSAIVIQQRLIDQYRCPVRVIDL